MSTSLHDRRYPGEDPAYRAARDTLLRAEHELRRKTEEVAALRRALPIGGVVAQDYVFEEGGSNLADRETVRKVRMSELFVQGDTLIAYSLMYGPKAKAACPMCTAMLDGLNGNAAHVAQRTNLVVIGRSPIARIREHARQRGWSNLRLLSSAGNDYNRDYFAESPDGDQFPALNVFVRRNGAIRHFWGAELFFVASEPGQNPRHVDSIWPLWNVLDLTPQGRGEDWYPRLDYGASG